MSRWSTTLLAFISALAATIALTETPMKSSIALKKTADTGTFARYVPFGDNREVIVRKGPERGHDYGLRYGGRKVKVQGGEFELVTYMATLSPPPLMSGQEPLSAQAAQNFLPVYEVLYLPDAEILLQRGPRGFSDAEVENILAAIAVK